MTRLARVSGEGPVLVPDGLPASLRAGGLAIYPTDTLYGLGADPRSPEGMRRLLAAKGRDAGKAVPLLLDGAARAAEWASGSSGAARRLMDAFWPGALTLVLPAAPGVLPEVTGGGATVGLRVPGHPVARAIAASIGGAVTGTSANRSGEPGLWRTEDELLATFAGEVDWVLWDGPPPGAGDAAGLPGGRSPASTVVRVEGDRLVLLREGAIPFRTITDFMKRG